MSLRHFTDLALNLVYKQWKVIYVRKYWKFQDLILKFCDTCEIYYTWEIVIFSAVDRFTTKASQTVLRTLDSFLPLLYFRVFENTNNPNWFLFLSPMQNRKLWISDLARLRHVCRWAGLCAHTRKKSPSFWMLISQSIF